MNKLHSIPHVTRLVFGTLAAVVLATAGKAAAAAEPVTSDQFAPGWQQHARPLFYSGMTRQAGRDRWEMPGILPSGEYVLVKRDGDKATLVDGYRVTVPTGNAKVYVFLDAGTGHDIEALPIADVPALTRPSSAASLAK